MITDLSERLKHKIEQALYGTDSCVFSPEVVLYNPNTGYKFNCRYLKAMAIGQDFFGSYMDMMQITIDVTPEELQALLPNLKDLECTITLYGFDDKTLTIIYDQEPIIIETKVLIDDQADLEKKFNISLFGDPETDTKLTADQNSMMFPYVLHLVEPEAYDLRHVQINAMFNEITMEKLLHWICQQFKAEQVKIVKPDNPQVYNNLVIPPMHDISSIFPFLQERYGIYSKGLGYYFTEKTFYIYPVFDVDPNTSPEEGTVHIVNAPQDYFLGLDRYHAKEGEDVFIASVTAVDMKPLNSEGTENLGNVHVSTNADGTLDKFVTIQEDGKVMRAENDISVVTMQNQAGNVTSDMQNLKFKGERTNIYSSTSEMAMIDGTMLSTGWMRATPRLLKPGQSALYHYDAKAGEYKTQKGRMFRVFYGGTLHTSESEKPWISFNASIEVKLEADQKSDEETQSLS